MRVHACGETIQYTGGGVRQAPDGCRERTEGLAVEHIKLHLVDHPPLIRHCIVQLVLHHEDVHCHHVGYRKAPRRSTREGGL